MKRLKREYQELANIWTNHYEDSGCCCHHNPPCGYCTHPGHPENLAESPDAWVEMLEPWLPGQEQILLGDDTPALEHGGLHWVENSYVHREKIIRQYDNSLAVRAALKQDGSFISVLLVDIERVFGGVA